MPRYPCITGDTVITEEIRDALSERASEFTWKAYHESNTGKPWFVGWGPTEQGALADLRRIIMERYEWQHEHAKTLEGE